MQVSQQIFDSLELACEALQTRYSTCRSRVADMAGPPNKRQKRQQYKEARNEEGKEVALPKKKFYRQRAHANPFSDHNLE